MFRELLGETPEQIPKEIFRHRKKKIPGKKSDNTSRAIRTQMFGKYMKEYEQ